MSREQSILSKMENELSLKQLQITSLLNITQAINENLPQEDLLSMYKNFLTWELSIEKIALFIREDNGWSLVVSSNLNTTKNLLDLPKEFIKFSRLHTVKKEDHPILQDFEFIIPVYHKKDPIAYSLINGVKRGDDIFNNIQFITSITNIIAVALENKRLVRKQITQEKELEFATEVTKMLIPEKMPSGKQYQLANVYRPHFKVGGDYIDFIKFSEEKICFCIADVSGKGIGAAMIMANFQALLQNLGQQYRDLETLVIALNETVLRITKGEKYLTFFIAVADIKQKKLYYVNLPEINEGVVDLDSDTILVAFTDGLVDIKNHLAENYTTEMLQELILQNKKKSVQELSSLVMETLMDYKGNEEVPDDIAILSFKFISDEK